MARAVNSMFPDRGQLSGSEKGGKISGEHIGGDEPHADGENPLQRGTREAGSQCAADKHVGESAADEQRGDRHRKLLPVREVRGQTGERDQENDEQRCCDRAMDAHAGHVEQRGNDDETAAHPEESRHQARCAAGQREPHVATGTEPSTGSHSARTRDGAGFDLATPHAQADESHDQSRRWRCALPRLPPEAAHSPLRLKIKSQKKLTVKVSLDCFEQLQPLLSPIR